MKNYLEYSFEMTNRNVEKERYDKRAKLILEKGKFSNITPAYLNEISYKYLFRILEKIKDEVKLLKLVEEWAKIPCN